jgi:hypothetical protein
LKAENLSCNSFPLASVSCDFRSSFFKATKASVNG